MDVRVLQYFLAVVREGGVTKAAAALHITQPTLSRQIAELERELGVSLFIRGGRGIELTNEGCILRRRAEEIVDLMERARADISEADAVEGTVSITGGDLAAMDLLSGIIADFSAEYPAVAFDLFTATADVARDRLLRGLADIGIMLEPAELTDLNYIRLPVHERWVALIDPDDPIASKESLTPDDLASRPLMLPYRINMRDEAASWFGPLFKDLRIMFKGNLPTNVTRIVSRGLAAAIVVEGSVPFLDRSRISVLPLSPELRTTSVMAWKRGVPLSKAVGKFIEHVRCFLGMEKQ